MQSDSKIPVFVFPNSMTFLLEDKTTHKRILSLYNPYDYPIKYRVLSTTPDRYIVNSPEGSIPSYYRADIVIRHNDLQSSNCDIIDKFRIQMHDKISKKILGRQDVTAVLRSNAQETFKTPDRENFRVFPSSTNQVLSSSISSTGNDHTHQTTAASSPNFVVLTIAVICISGLFLPTENENSSLNRFQVSVGLKLIFSYVLGLVTMVILKS